MKDVSFRRDKEEDEIAKQIVDSTILVHRELGPGLLESVYEACLYKELIDRGYVVSRQVPVPIIFKGQKIEAAFKADLIVENRVILELKTVDALLPVHEAQLLSYMKMMGMRLGFLINFKEALVKHGIKRFVRRQNSFAS